MRFRDKKAYDYDCKDSIGECRDCNGNFGKLSRRRSDHEKRRIHANRCPSKLIGADMVQIGRI